MADEEKTEQATPKHREDAKKKGQIVQSKDLNHALTLMVAAILLSFMGTPIYKNIFSMTKRFFLYQFDKNSGLNYLLIRSEVFQYTIMMLAPLLIGIMTITILIYGIQTKFTIFEERIGIKLEKLDVVKNIKNMFTLKQATMPLLMLGKLIAVSIVAYITIRSELPQWLSGTFTSSTMIMGRVWTLIMTIIFRTGVLLIIIGILDYSIQWVVLEKSLMMTKQEIKEEYKREEISPEMKQQQRRRAQKMAQDRMMQQVPEATVVITNPTQLAIALKYEEKKMDAPKVIAKGKNHIAHKIKTVAKEHDIPIVEDKPLARALYPNIEVGDSIPPKFYQAIAILLAYVYKNIKEYKGYAEIGKEHDG